MREHAPFVRRPLQWPATNGPVRYAVVGLGQISQQAFLPAMARAGSSVLAALVTGTPDKARELARSGPPEEDVGLEPFGPPELMGARR